jgi:hypothetical protein
MNLKELFTGRKRKREAERKAAEDAAYYEAEREKLRPEPVKKRAAKPKDKMRRKAEDK